MSKRTPHSKMSDFALHTGQSSPRTRRSHSISSDRPSLSGFGGLLSPPTTVSPDPAFIAASAASQIVTNDHDSQADAWFDQHGIEPSGETALVAAPALKLVNRFLDQLLFNFLSISRSTSLSSLRPAISEVLKPKLAKDAINGADQELHEYLGGGEDEEVLALHNGLEPSSDWDLELVWKRTRLRCMVYSSLGDMEEEDEDYYTEQDHLDDPRNASRRFSNNPGVVSPAVAIFLTSILEFMGEQVLIVAGQAAYHRLRAKHEKEDKDETSVHADIAERVVVEEADMERVALDRTLGRLWRAWKKRIRSPTTSVYMARPFSRESMRSVVQSRAASVAPEDQIDEDDQSDEDTRRPSLATVLSEFEYAASLPLPITEDDVREIEIPGLAKHEDDVEEDVLEEEDIRQAPRPKSWIAFPQNYEEVAQDESSPTEISESQPARPSQFMTRKRSDSEPRLMWSPFVWRPTKKTKLSAEEYIASDETVLQDGEVGSAEGLKSNGEDDEAAVAESPVVEELALTDGSKEVPSKLSDASEPEVELKTKQSSVHASLAAGVIGGAAAIGIAAVVGIVAAAKGEAPQTLTQTSQDATNGSDTEEEFIEEPRIMTSHRISIGGRMTPDDAKESTRRSSIRSPSVHSVRVVDVASTKSPAGSRHSSVGPADYAPTGRPALHSPTLSDAPRVGSPISRGPTSNPSPKVASALGPRPHRNSVGNSIHNSISEVEEKNGGKLDPELDADIPSSPAYPAAFAGALPSVDLQTSRPHDLPVNGLKRSVTSAPEEQVASFSSSPKVKNLLVERPTNGVPKEALVTPTSPTKSFEYPSPYRGQNNSKVASPPPLTKVDSRKSIPENTSRVTRSLHTSGSGSSSTSHKLKPVRTSEESRTESKSQSFEQLIQSDQTIQYTLTPQNMRDIEAPESPRINSFGNNAFDGRPLTSRSQSSSVSKFVGLKSNSPIDSPKSTKAARAFKPIPRPSSNTGARLRPNAPQARDARVDRDSIGDFAEFIRSTGPANTYEPVPPRTASTMRSANGSTRTASGAGMRSGGPSSLKRTDSSANRARLQARDAVVPRGDSISDLIDFVRSGPQLEKENHRIPRTVAPFRTTMDSDQMSGAVGGKAVDASLPDPRYSQTTPSVNSSVTSQAPLLNSSRNKTLPTKSKNDFDEEDRMPKRKTRRVRDPYAIDFSDEENEYEAVTKGRPKVIEEESLADFLRNVPPPPDSSPSPLLSAAAAKNVKKKVSSPGLMSRFGRNPGSPQLPPKPQGQSAPKTYAPIAAQFSTSQPSSQSRSGTTYVSQVEGARKKVQQKSYQPREAVYAGSRTNDLADFLRSEPPSNMAQTQPQTFVPALQKDEASAFQRMFGRKKVH